MIRITADLDNTSLKVAKFRTSAIVFHLWKKKFITIDKSKIRKSSSGKGCHVILFTSQRLTKQEILFIRMLLGDDIKRIKRDLKRRRAKQYLFRTKLRLVSSPEKLKAFQYKKKKNLRKFRVKKTMIGLRGKS